MRRVEELAGFEIRSFSALNPTIQFSRTARFENRMALPPHVGSAARRRVRAGRAKV